MYELVILYGGAAHERPDDVDIFMPGRNNMANTSKLAEEMFEDAFVYIELIEKRLYRIKNRTEVHGWFAQTDNVVATTRAPWRALVNLPFRESWSYTWVGPEPDPDEEKDHRWVRLWNAIHAGIADTLHTDVLWTCVAHKHAPGEYSGRYKGYYGGRTEADLHHALRLTHPDVDADAEVCCFTVYTADLDNGMPRQLVSDDLRAKWKKERDARKEVRDFVHEWAFRKNHRHVTVYAGVSSETCKTRHPTLRLKTHKSDICYGHRRIVQKIPVVASNYAAIDPDRHKIVVWNTMTGDMYYGPLVHVERETDSVSSTSN